MHAIEWVVDRAKNADTLNINWWCSICARCFKRKSVINFNSSNSKFSTQNSHIVHFSIFCLRASRHENRKFYRELECNSMFVCVTFNFLHRNLFKHLSGLEENERWCRIFFLTKQKFLIPNIHNWNLMIEATKLKKTSPVRNLVLKRVSFSYKQANKAKTNNIFNKNTFNNLGNLRNKNTHETKQVFFQLFVPCLEKVSWKLFI